jgi:hypothetical protein
MWLSIQGIYEFDPSVFDGFESPSYTDPDDNTHVLDRETVINNILLQCAELELIYPSVQMMKFAIGVWSASNSRTWDKLYKSMFVEYNPIWNVDATETETETNERDINRQHTGSNNETLNLSDAETRNLSDAETVNLTDTESVQGFNSNSWSESKKLVKTGTDTTNHTGTDTILHTGTDNTAITNNETVSDDNERINTKRRTGNIGVTATQDLIEKERKIADFSIIEYITQSFKERFCLLVY